MATQCPKCGSKNGVWNGHHTTNLGKKRRRLCRDCGCFFTVNGGFLRMRYRKEIILIAVFLYNCGLSLAKVAEFLWQLMNVKLPRKTILLWDRKYSNIIKNFVEKLKPKIKGSVHFDEVFLKVKGKQVYLWGAIDRKTKFRFSGPLTQTRPYEKGAKPLFRQVKYGSKGTPPRIVSDKLGHYKKGFDKYFRNGGAKLSHGVPIACKKYGLKFNNNPIERDQRRIRQFSNPKGSFQDHRSAEEQLSLYDSFHNYIFPHPGLRGRTPAETAGIHLSLGRNRLNSLIKMSSRGVPREHISH
jgi:transposase-like protein